MQARAQRRMATTYQRPFAMRFPLWWKTKRFKSTKRPVTQSNSSMTSKANNKHQQPWSTWTNWTRPTQTMYTQCAHTRNNARNATTTTCEIANAKQYTHNNQHANTNAIETNKPQATHKQRSTCHCKHIWTYQFHNTTQWTANMPLQHVWIYQPQSNTQTTINMSHQTHFVALFLLHKHFKTCAGPCRIMAGPCRNTAGGSKFNDSVLLTRYTAKTLFSLLVNNVGLRGAHHGATWPDMARHRKMTTDNLQTEWKTEQTQKRYSFIGWQQLTTKRNNEHMVAPWQLQRTHEPMRALQRNNLSQHKLAIFQRLKNRNT